MIEAKRVSPLFIGWVAALGVVILAGLITTYQIFSVGLGVLGLNDVVVWALPTAAYIYFTGASFGLCILSTIPILFGVKHFEPIAKRAVFLAIATLLGGLIALVLHTGSPLNAIYVLLSPNPTSPFAWVMIFYSIYLVALLAEFRQMHQGDGDGKAVRFFSAVALLAALGFHSSVGSVFGLTASRPAFSGALFPLYFPLAALVTGFAAAILANLLYQQFTREELAKNQSALFDTLAKVFAGLLGILLLFTFWKTAVGLYSTGTGFEVFEHMIGTWTFHFQIWVGLMVPFLLMLIPSLRKSNVSKGVASALVLVGIFMGRIELVESGLTVPLGPRAFEFSSFVTPNHTIWGWLVAAFSLAVILLLYTFGERYLKLNDSAASTTKA